MKQPSKKHIKNFLNHIKELAGYKKSYGVEKKYLKNGKRTYAKIMSFHCTLLAEKIISQKESEKSWESASEIERAVFHSNYIEATSKFEKS